MYSAMEASSPLGEVLSMMAQSTSELSMVGDGEESFSPTCKRTKDFTLLYSNVLNVPV